MKQVTLGSMAGSLILMVLGLGFSVPTAKAIAPKVTGTAKYTGTPTDIVPFLVLLKVDPNVTSGVRFHPVTRIILDDGTWVSGMLSCFPGGSVAGGNPGGPCVFFKSGLPKGRVPKSIEIMACEGERGPVGNFEIPGEGRSLHPLDGPTMKKLSRAGGFLIRVPVTR